MASNFPTAYVRVASQTYVLQHIFNCTLHGCDGRIVATIASKQTIQLLTVTLDLLPDVLQDTAAAILSVNLVQNRGNASLLIHLALQNNLVENAMTKLMITTN